MNLKIFLPLSAIFILTISRVSCEHSEHIWNGINLVFSFIYFRFPRSVEMTVHPILHLEMEIRCPTPFSASTIISIKCARIFRIFVTSCRQCYPFRTQTIYGVCTIHWKLSNRTITQIFHLSSVQKQVPMRAQQSQLIRFSNSIGSNQNRVKRRSHQPV